MKGSRRALVWSVGVLGILIVAIQFVPVDRSNAATQTQVPASAEARAVLTRACYDCHSNETAWPWYSYVAPVSWLVARDVREGRQKLNFSTWNLLSSGQQSEGVKESWEKVQEGEMPLWFYLPLHPSARLSDADRSVLQAWASSGGIGTGASMGPDTGIGTGSGADITGGTGTGSGTDVGTRTGAGASGDQGSGVGGAGESPPTETSTTTATTTSRAHRPRTPRHMLARGLLATVETGS